jgi:hypothetical protein
MPPILINVIQQDIKYVLNRLTPMKVNHLHLKLQFYFIYLLVNYSQNSIHHFILQSLIALQFMIVINCSFET